MEKLTSLIKESFESFFKRFPLSSIVIIYAPFIAGIVGVITKVWIVAFASIGFFPLWFILSVILSSISLVQKHKKLEINDNSENLLSKTTGFLNLLLSIHLSLPRTLYFCLVFTYSVSYLFSTFERQYFNRQSLNIDYENFSFFRKILFKIFVEEYINDRDTVQKGWERKGLTVLEIRLKTILLDLDTLKGLLVCKIQNIGLDRNKIE